jgi:hypothetical protein
MLNIKNFQFIILLFIPVITFSQSEKATLRKNITNILRVEELNTQTSVNSFIQEAAYRNSNPIHADFLLNSIERYQIFKKNENLLMPTLIKNMESDASSRKILLLFNINNDIRNRLISLCKNDNVEVKAKLGDDTALRMIEQKINGVLIKIPFDFNAFTQLIDDLIYVNSKESNKILSQLLSSDKTVNGTCDKTLGNKMNYSIFSLVLRKLRGQYLDIDLMLLNDDSFDNNTTTLSNVIATDKYNKRIEKVLKKKYGLNIEIKAPYLWQYEICAN